MNVEAIVWTFVFFGGVILILSFLLIKAIQANKTEARQRASQEQADYQDSE